MQADNKDLLVLQEVWNKAELRDAFQKLVLQAIGRANVQLTVPSALAMFEAMDSLLSSEKPAPKVRNENI